jgi:hypothetical protein
VKLAIALCVAMLARLIALPARTVAAGSPQSGYPAVTISVHDYANVPVPRMAAAEAQAARIFQRAGLETAWLSCGPRVEAIEPKACLITDRTHLTLKILPRALTRQTRNRCTVLGLALMDDQGIGYTASVFYDRVLQLAARRNLENDLLGALFAHEIGHLLLGSSSHSPSGIMCPRWRDKELLIISEGALSFLPAQSKAMRDRLTAFQSGSLEVSLVAD